VIFEANKKHTWNLGFSLFLSTALSLSENLKSIADSIIEIYQFNIYFESFKKYCELTEQVKDNIKLSVQVYRNVKCEN
jgi:hypothetical protein